MSCLRCLRSSVVLLAVAAPLSCGRDDVAGGGASPPDGVTCGSIVTAADGASAARALDGGTAGSCVVLTGAEYDVTALVVKPGVALVGQKGARPTLRSKENAGALVTLEEGATLANVVVADAPVAGVVVHGASASLRDVKVTGAKNVALAVSCRASCASGKVVLEDVTLEKSYVGFMAAGAVVSWRRGRVAENGTTSLTSGIGVVASDGAKLELEDVSVEKNGGTGVLVDGKATSLATKNVRVLDNAERGVWAQNVDGTLDAPSVRLEGTEVARNKIVGVGALESRGIIVVGGRVAETLAAPVVTNLATTEEVGDGLGVFGGSTDVKIDGTAIEANVRAAGIIDGSDRGIIVVGGRVSAGPSGLKIVVQNTSTKVEIGEDARSVTPKALGVSAPKIKLPALAP